MQRLYKSSVRKKRRRAKIKGPDAEAIQVKGPQREARRATIKRADATVLLQHKQAV